MLEQRSAQSIRLKVSHIITYTNNIGLRNLTEIPILKSLLHLTRQIIPSVLRHYKHAIHTFHTHYSTIYPHTIHQIFKQKSFLQHSYATTSQYTHSIPIQHSSFTTKFLDTIHNRIEVFQSKAQHHRSIKKVEYKNSPCFLILDILACPNARVSFVLTTKHDNHCQ